MHGMLSEVKRKVQFLHKMFSKERQNVDGCWRNVPWTNRELTECLADGHKVDECWDKSCCCMDIWRMFPRTHRKLMKIYGRSRGCMASWQRLKEEPADVRKIDRRSNGCMDIPTTSVKLLCIWGTIHQLLVHQQDLQSSSVNIPCSRQFSPTCINFPCIRGTFSQCYVQMRYHPSTFQLSGDVPSTSVNFQCIRGTIH